MNKYRATFSSTAFDPHIALENLDDAIQALDTQIKIKNPHSTIINKDLPIMINGKSGDGEQLCLYSLDILEVGGMHDPSKDTAYPPSDIPEANFQLGHSVVHIDTGLEQIIRTTVYYHGTREYYYVTVYEAPGYIAETNQYPETQLISKDDFDLFNAKLNETTGKTWFMDQSIGMFVCMSNKVRKMYMSDARHVINTHITPIEVPF